MKKFFQNIFKNKSLKFIRLHNSSFLKYFYSRKDKYKLKEKITQNFPIPIYMGMKKIDHL